MLRYFLLFIAFSGYLQASLAQPSLAQTGLVQTGLVPKSSVLLKHEINKIVQPAGRKAAVGIKIISLKSDYCLYQKNPDQLFKPASNTKLFTAASALEILTPEFRFETQLITDYHITPSKINHLYIKGGGDPSLKTTHLEEMVKKLHLRGIKEIKGNIVIDASIFDSSARAPGWNKADGPIFDKSPVNGLMLNHCCITVHIRPARIPGHKPHVSLDPAVGYITIENRARTTTKAKKHSLHVFRTKSSERKIIVTGTISTKAKHKAYLIVLDNPQLYTAHVLQSLLRKHNIIHKGSIVVGKAPLGTPPVGVAQSVEMAQPADSPKLRNRRARPTLKTSVKPAILARHYSAPLSELVRFMMKSSDNLYADAFFKKMGSVIFEEQGTWENGKNAVDSFLIDDAGFKPGEVQLFDGSGLSHSNRVSPNQFAHLLSWMYKKSEHKNIFMESLPISGIDGTLKHRMRDKKVHAKVKAKTGNLPGVSSLAGYITPKNGNPLLFVIIVNRKNKSAIEFKRKLEDHLCTFLATHAFSIT